MITLLSRLFWVFTVATISFVTCASSPTIFIVSGSRYWFNYRHSSNALVFYSAARRLGVRDDAIALFLPASHESDARNVIRGTIVNGQGDAAALGAKGVWPGGGRAASPIEVDFADAAATPDALLRALRGRGGPSSPLLTGGPLFLMLTGHGGDGFLKFHDKDELSYTDLAVALAAAGIAHRYSSLFLIADTCQAASVTQALEDAHVPRATVLSSSAIGENSYSVELDEILALAVSDSFSRDAAYTLNRAFIPPNGRDWRGSNVGSLAEICSNTHNNGRLPSSAQFQRACKFVKRSRSPAYIEATLGWSDAIDSIHASAALSSSRVCKNTIKNTTSCATLPLDALVAAVHSHNSASSVSIVAIKDQAIVNNIPLLRYFAGSDDIIVV